MPIDYDLVVIGGGTAARYAATLARQFHARVALVDPTPTQISLLDTERMISQSLQQAAREVLSLNWGDRPLGDERSLESLQAAFKWANTVAQVQAEQQSLPGLASLGIDVLAGAGEFRRRPHIAFVVNGRLLRSRAYLLACDAQPGRSEIHGLETVPHLTLESLLQVRPFERLPGHLVIIGRTPGAITWAQSLGRFGIQVTLICESALLPNADAEVAWWIQAQLEAEGIQVLTNTPVPQVKQLDGQTWVQAGNRAIAADQVLVLDTPRPRLEALNLTAVNVKHGPHGVWVNARLQTQNPRIYACGEAIGGERDANLALAEAVIAVKNALFFSTRTFVHTAVPKVVSTEPEFAQVGLTEVNARQRYHDTEVLKEYFQPLSCAQINNQTTGICKIILRKPGQILGAHIMGPQAGNLIGIFALAIQKNIKMGAIAQCSFPVESYADIMNTLSTSWTTQTLNTSWRRNLLERFLTLRRDWTSQ